MKLLYGTGNPAKLDAMRHRLAGLGIELIGLKDLGGVKQPEIIEDGKTPLENARKKAEAYFNALHMPVFSCDSGIGLFFEKSISCFFCQVLFLRKCYTILYYLIPYCNSSC